MGSKQAGDRAGGRTLADYPNHPFAGLDVASLLAERARQRGAHPFLLWEPFVGESACWSYAAFAAQAARTAAGLFRRGVRPGDKILIHLDNCPESLFAWYGCAILGAVAVTTNARSSGEELGYFAGHSGAIAAMTQPRFAELVAAHCPDLRWIAVTATDNGAPPAAGQAPAAGDSFAALDGDPADLPRRAPDPLAPVGVQYTSGTTSRPKGVLWTHANALWGARINALHQSLVPEDVHLTYLPLFHTNAQAYSVLAALWVGASVVVQPRFSASRFWPVSLKHRCTWTSLVPFCVRALMEHPVPLQHAYRLWGNALCAPPTDAHFRVKTIGWWGMTETITHGIVGDPWSENRSMMIGRAAPEYGISVRDEEGREVAPGETGDLLVKGLRGLSLFQEYLDNPEATAASFDEQGWFRTGDRLIRHADGFLQFADRAKDMLKVGGENVAASEIERVILTVPGVREVAVVGRKHPMLDEVPIALIIPDEAAGVPAAALLAAVSAACAAALADFKRPHEVRLAAEFPRSTLEKIAKAQLRRQIEREAVETTAPSR